MIEHEHRQELIIQEMMDIAKEVQAVDKKRYKLAQRFHYLSELYKRKSAIGIIRLNNGSYFRHDPKHVVKLLEPIENK